MSPPNEAIYFGPTPFCGQPQNHHSERRIIMEFWAVIGLACLDQVFLRELERHKDNPEPTVREFGFRLTRWEMGELKRVLSLDSAFNQMGMICHMFWAEAFDPEDGAPCWWSAERS